MPAQPAFRTRLRSAGSRGQTNGLAGFSEDQIRQRIKDMQRQGGGNGDIANMLMGAMAGGGLGGPEARAAPEARAGRVQADRRAAAEVRVADSEAVAVSVAGFRGQNANAWHGAFAYTGFEQRAECDTVFRNRHGRCVEACLGYEYPDRQCHWDAVISQG